MSLLPLKGKSNNLFFLFIISPGHRFTSYFSLRAANSPTYSPFQKGLESESFGGRKIRNQKSSESERYRIRNVQNWKGSELERFGSRKVQNQTGSEYE
jgi:hypothetical protein